MNKSLFSLIAAGALVWSTNAIAAEAMPIEQQDPQTRTLNCGFAMFVRDTSSFFGVRVVSADGDDDGRIDVILKRNEDYNYEGSTVVTFANGRYQLHAGILAGSPDTPWASSSFALSEILKSGKATTLSSVTIENQNYDNGYVTPQNLNLVNKHLIDRAIETNANPNDRQQVIELAKPNELVSVHAMCLYET
jgi:hypothetical protein